MRNIINSSWVVFLIFILGLGNFSSLFGQTPNAINYQAVARNSAGSILNNQSLQVRLGIYSGVGASVKVYEEVHSATTNQFGLFSLKIGMGTPVMGTFSSIMWQSNEHHLKV